MSEKKKEEKIGELYKEIYECLEKLRTAVDDAQDILTSDEDDFTIIMNKYGNDIYIVPQIDSHAYLKRFPVQSLDKVGECINVAKWEWLCNLIDYMKELIKQLYAYGLQAKAIAET